LLYVREDSLRGIEMSVIERQANLVAMVQDAIVIDLEKGQDISGLVVNLKHLVDMLNVLSALGTKPSETGNRQALARGDDRKREEYERDVRRQYARMKQSPVPPTQYVYNDGFQGVTISNERQQQPRQEPYRLEEREYWDDEQ
jgi:hypothetical protein